MDTLKTSLDRLVAETVLTSAQADAVLAAMAEPKPRRRISPAAEVIGYVGGVLATVAALVVAAEFWAQLEFGSQFGIFVLVAVALWGAGRSISTVDDPAAGRLMGTLWLLSTAAAGAAGWVAADGLLGSNGEKTALAIGLVTTVHALVLWLVRRGALQQIGLFAGVMTTVGAGLALLPNPPDELYGLAVWAVGVAWALLAWGGQLRPARTGAAIGAVTAVIGAEILTFAHETPGLVLSLISVAALFAAAAATRQAVFVGVASVALAIVLPQALSSWFPDSVGAPTAVFIAGSVLLGGALATLRTARGTSDESTPASP